MVPKQDRANIVFSMKLHHKKSLAFFALMQNNFIIETEKQECIFLSYKLSKVKKVVVEKHKDRMQEGRHHDGKNKRLDPVM